MKLRTLYIKPMYKIKAKVYVYILICGYIAASGGERERESIEDGVYIYNVSHINTHTLFMHINIYTHTRPRKCTYHEESKCIEVPKHVWSSLRSVLKRACVRSRSTC